jgi:hypothetical protein
MNFEIITKEDLKDLETRLLAEIRKMLAPDGRTASKEWLKSSEVRKLLKISAGTLQNLRVKGTLRFTRIGGIRYYRQDDINQLLEGGMR